MNATELVDVALDRARSVTSDAMITRDRMLGWLNDGLRRYQGERRWPWLDATSSVPLVADQRRYSLPAGWQIVRWVRCRPATAGLEYQLEQISTEELARLPLNRSGDPTLFAVVSESEFEVWPAPKHSGAVLDLAYTGSEPTLVESPDPNSPLLPEVLQDVIIDHAVRAALLKIGNVEEARMYPAADSPEAQARVARVANARRGPVRVRPRRY